MSDVTRLLDAAAAGDRRAAADLLPLVYDELRKLAAARMSAGSPRPHSRRYRPRPRSLSAPRWRPAVRRPRALLRRRRGHAPRPGGPRSRPQPAEKGWGAADRAKKSERA